MVLSSVLIILWIDILIKWVVLYDVKWVRLVGNWFFIFLIILFIFLVILRVLVLGCKKIFNSIVFLLLIVFLKL